MSKLCCKAILCLALVLCAVSCATAGAPRHDKDGFVPLFDGKTLDGWRAADMSFWSVQDGAITADDHRAPTPPTVTTTWSSKAAKLADFELKLTPPHPQFRTTSTAASSSAARSSTATSPTTAAGTRSTTTPGPTGSSVSTTSSAAIPSPGAARRAVFDNERRENDHSHRSPQPRSRHTSRLDDWHEYHLICRGTHLTLKINGRPPSRKRSTTIRNNRTSPASSPCNCTAARPCASNSRTCASNDWMATERGGR